MNLKLAVLVLFVGLILSGNQTSAQIKSLLKEKTKGALGKQLKRGEEEKSQQQEGEEEKPAHQSEPNPMSGYMQNKMMGMMGMKNVKHDMIYDFTSSMTMEIVTTDSPSTKPNKVLYTTYFDKGSRSFAMEFEEVDPESSGKEKGLMIFDYKNWAMLILSEKNSERSGIAMEIPRDSAVMAQQQEGVQPLQQPGDLSVHNLYYKATGRTKSIAGYRCKEYVYENPEGKAVVWATNDVVFDYSNAYGHMGGLGALATGGTTYGLGTVMEMHFTDKHSTAKSELTVKEIRPSNSKSINLTGYQIVGMGGGEPKQ